MTEEFRTVSDADLAALGIPPDGIPPGAYMEALQSGVPVEAIKRRFNIPDQPIRPKPEIQEQIERLKNAEVIIHITEK